MNLNEQVVAQYVGQIEEVKIINSPMVDLRHHGVY